jgi:adenosylcobinamide kinase / adenosylcobinamide-phosphate guanylyltransferase
MMIGGKFMEKNKLILVTGGARSGKSTFAEQLAEQYGRPITYIATAQVFDEEMRERIRIHRERRAAYWLTVEAPYDAEAVIRRVGMDTPVILVDCLTLFVTNYLLKEVPVDANSEKYTYQECVPKVLQSVRGLAEAAKSVPGCVIVVTNEVGLGIVPGDPLSRAFRDIAGWANQCIAAAADEVYFVVSGIPMRIKPSGA